MTPFLIYNILSSLFCALRYAVCSVLQRASSYSLPTSSMTANLHPALMMPHVFTEERKHIQKELQSIVKQKTHAPSRLGY